MEFVTLSRQLHCLRKSFILGQTLVHHSGLTKSSSPIVARSVTRSSSTSQVQWSRSISHPENVEPKRAIITGGLGLLGPDLAESLRRRHGRENILLTDIRIPDRCILDRGPFAFADVLDIGKLRELIVNHRADWLVHYSTVAGWNSENNLPLSIKINMEAVRNVLELAREFNLRIFIPSTIAAFGPESPRDPTPDICIQRPKTMYGIAKVNAELLGEYYQHRFGVDFRCLRYPRIISSDDFTPGGTVDYALTIFHSALEHGKYECFLKPDTRLPMMYIDDCIKGTVEFLESPQDCLSLRTYNFGAMSFSPEELAEEIRKHIPHFQISYNVTQSRQDIADTWPKKFDDSRARKDWGWSHDYDIAGLVECMLTTLRERKVLAKD